MPFKTFCERIDRSLQECGQQRQITLESLAKQFAEPEWEGLATEDSPLSNVFLSDAFRVTPERIPTQINANHLKLFGLLHCIGHPKEKATYLSNVINNTQNPQNALDFNFEKLCALASWELCNMAAKSDPDLDFYSTNDIARLKA